MSSTISRLIGAIPSSSSSSKPIDQTFMLNPVTKTSFLKNKESAWNLHGRSCRSLQNLSMLTNLQTTTFVRRSNVNPPPEPPLPSGSPSGSLRNWIVGLVLTFILPFITHKWGSLLLLKNQVGEKLETAEIIVKAIENVAERVDKTIDSITDELPDSQLKKALKYADEIAEGIAKTAHVADDLINKVEEAEDKLDKLESLIHKEDLNRKKTTQAPIQEEDNDITAQEQNEKK